MEFKLFKVSGYEEAVNSLRMSKGKYYSWQTAQEIQQLAYLVTDEKGAIIKPWAYDYKLGLLTVQNIANDFSNRKITENYDQDVAEFKRLLELTFNNTMGEFKHHTLMKYIDVSFFTEGLHRGAQDDLDAHAIAFNNRITRFSTRLAEIDDVKLSEWYQDKVIPIYEALEIMQLDHDTMLPEFVFVGEERYDLTPFGYVLTKFAQVPAKNGLAKDVQRGLMPLGLASNAIWKTDLFNLRYVYKMRSKLTKANPELKLGMEQLADQIEKHIPVFGPYFRKELTDSGSWEHMNKVKTITSEEYQLLKELKKGITLPTESNLFYPNK